MTAEEIKKQLQPWVETRRRPAWLPVLEPGLRDPKGSHFGGGAWIPEGEEAPTCGGCGETLRLLLQLNLASLPEGAHGALPKSGLLQVFYCEDEECEQEEDAAMGFSDAHHVRTIPLAADGRVVESAEPFAPNSIVGWKAVTDIPHASEHDELGLKFEYDFKAKRQRVHCDEVGLHSDWIPLDALEAEEISQSLDGDKLRGWPYWVQGPEYPRCPQCRQPMTNVFQIESEKGLPYMWGDSGVVQVTHCERHPDVMTMGWACC